MAVSPMEPVLQGTVDYRSLVEVVVTATDRPVVALTTQTLPYRTLVMADL